jgi:hypothetical protein
MKTIFLILILLTLGLCSCFFNDDPVVKNETPAIDTLSMNFVDSINYVKSKALEKGDIISYEKLEIYYLDYSPRSFLSIADSFANKFNYRQAHFDVYRYMQFVYGFKPGEFDDKTLEKKDFDLVMKHLVLAAKMKHPQAIEILEKHKKYLLRNK